MCLFAFFPQLFYTLCKNFHAAPLDMQIFFVYTYEENLRYGGIIMTDFMQIICDYLLENRCKEFLPREYYWHYTRLAEKQESALLDRKSVV